MYIDQHLQLFTISEFIKEVSNSIGNLKLRKEVKASTQLSLRGSIVIQVARYWIYHIIATYNGIGVGISYIYHYIHDHATN